MAAGLDGREERVNGVVRRGEERMKYLPKPTNTARYVTSRPLPKWYARVWIEFAHDGSSVKSYRLKCPLRDYLDSL